MISATSSALVQWRENLMVISILFAAQVEIPDVVANRRQQKLQVEVRVPGIGGIRKTANCDSANAVPGHPLSRRHSRQHAAHVNDRTRSRLLERQCPNGHGA